MKLSMRFFKRLPAKEKKVTISTLLTIVRIVLTPGIVAAMVLHYWAIAGVLFTIAAVTDLLDGNIARWRGEQTLLGACLDPIADKILILSCFVTLALVQFPVFVIPAWFWSIIFIKEIIILGGAVVIYAMIGHIKVQPVLLGKITTFVQMSFILWLFACYFFAWIPIKTYYTMLSLVLVLVIACLIQYSVMGIQWLYND